MKLKRAKIELEIGQPRLALKDLNEVIGHEPTTKNPEQQSYAHLMRAQVHLSLNQYDRAIDDANKFLALTEKSAGSREADKSRAHCYIGMALLAKREYAAAEKELLQAIPPASARAQFIGNQLTDVEQLHDLNHVFIAYDALSWLYKNGPQKSEEKLAANKLQRAHFLADSKAAGFGLVPENLWGLSLKEEASR